MRTNYVLIDLENVQPESLQPLAHDHFKVFVFVGAGQNKLSYDIAASLQELGSRAEYIKISGNGLNALDFHIAYYIGRLAAADTSAYFHIVSKDSGFDPLIRHLKDKGVLSGRVKSIKDIPLVKSSSAKTPDERFQVALTWLQQTKASKPRTVKTLRSTVASLFQKQLSEDQIAAIVQGLVEKKHLVVAGSKVMYPAAEGDA